MSESAIRRRCWSLGVRSWMFAPAGVAILVFGLFVALSLRTFDESYRTLLSVQIAAAGRSGNVSDLSNEVVRVNSILLAVLADSARIGQKELNERTRPILDRLTDIESRLREQPIIFIDDENDGHGALYGRLLERFSAYRREAVSAVQMSAAQQQRMPVFLAGANAAFRDMFAMLAQIDVENRSVYNAAVEAVEANLRETERELVVGIVLALVLSALAALLMSRALVRDLLRLIGRLGDLSEGRIRDDPIDIVRADEIGELARGVANFEAALRRLGWESQERRRRERDLANLFESSSDAIFVVSKGHYIDANQRAEELLECERDQIIGKPVGSFSAEYRGDPDGAIARVRQEIAASGGHVYGPVERRNRTISGREFPSEMSIALTEDSNGEELVQVIIRDISARQQVEQIRATAAAELERLVDERTAALNAEMAARREADQALGKVRELLETTVDNAPVGIIVLDEDLNVKLVNAQFRRQHGAAADGVEVGKPFEIFIRGVLEREMEKKPHERVDIERVLRERMESLARFEDAEFEGMGTNLKISRRYVPGFGYVISNVDISDLKAAEARTEAARELLLATVENAPAGILLVDQELKVRVANSTYRDLYGLSADIPLIGEPYIEVVR
ncbi:MAG: PAS domain S-box protein, partial [Alphaproteobacteria bacterium]